MGDILSASIYRLIYFLSFLSFVFVKNKLIGFFLVCILGDISAEELFNIFFGSGYQAGIS